MVSGIGFSGQDLFRRSRKRRRRGREVDWILWGIPLAMIGVAGILIASTQRQADYADWYHHWITAGVGVCIALSLARLSLLRLRPLLIPIYGLTVISLVAVRMIGTTALGAQRWISVGGFTFSPLNSPSWLPSFCWQPCWIATRSNALWICSDLWE